LKRLPRVFIAPACAVVTIWADKKRAPRDCWSLLRRRGLRAKTAGEKAGCQKYRTSYNLH
jgi:hypothetical protein